MPGHVRNTRVRSSAGRDGIDTFTGLGVEDLDPVPAVSGLVAGAADITSVEAPAEGADSAELIAEEGTLAD